MNEEQKLMVFVETLNWLDKSDHSLDDDYEYCWNQYLRLLTYIKDKGLLSEFIHYRKHIVFS